MTCVVEGSVPTVPGSWHAGRRPVTDALSRRSGKPGVFIERDKLNTLGRMRHSGVAKKSTPSEGPWCARQAKKCWRKKTRNTKDLCHSRRARKGKESIGTALALRGERKRIGSESQTSCEY